MNQYHNPILGSNAFKLFLCGASALFWELLLIRWVAACIPMVSFYSNFILMAAFLGLGVGALCVRFKFRLLKYLFPVLFVCVGVGPLFNNLSHCELFKFLCIDSGSHTYLNTLITFLKKMGIENTQFFILAVVYILNTFLFVIFGQWLGTLFQNFKPLLAYTIEVGGSILGILIFSIISGFGSSPLVWICIGFFLVFFALDNKRKYWLSGIIFISMTLIVAHSHTKQFIWSPYNKISISAIDKVIGEENERVKTPHKSLGYLINLNNYYQQLILDLAPRQDESDFFKFWREFYDLPYHYDFKIPEGPTLIIGAGGGNDVAAALRNDVDYIDALEVDPYLIDIGKKYHPEKPYDDKKVNIHLNDARSYLKNTNKKYARVVFGFIDSHCLLSTYSSIRVENFVFTFEAMKEIKKLLLPDGKVFLSYAGKNKWQNERLMYLFDSVFDFKTEYFENKENPYFNSKTYMNGKSIKPVIRKSKNIFDSSKIIPTDDWPFWYLEKEKLPEHYLSFILMILIAGLTCLLLLPKGQRKIQFTYFFLGAGFFLIETSNVTNLSLLFGSNTMVNVAVFTWILGLILLGNFTCFIMRRPMIFRTFGFLMISILVSYFIPPSVFLSIKVKWIQGTLAGFVFLSPVYFTSLIFAHLIQRESNFYQVYGSNLLGAVVGGACEYFSLIGGIKFLLLITFAFYILAALSIKFSAFMNKRPTPYRTFFS